MKSLLPKTGKIIFSRRSSAWLERRSFKPMVRGSNPRAGTMMSATLWRFGYYPALHLHAEVPTNRNPRMARKVLHAAGRVIGGTASHSDLSARPEEQVALVPIAGPVGLQVYLASEDRLQVRAWQSPFDQ